jgi:spermidine/putrescine transport system permease protein
MAKQFSITRLPGFGAIALLTFVLLYLPIIILVVFSFNENQSQSIWGGFSLRWYEAAFENRQVRDVSIRSLWLALVASSHCHDRWPRWRLWGQRGCRASRGRPSSMR